MRKAIPITTRLPLVERPLYNSSMDNVVRNVKDIDSSDRQALEHVLGLPLDDNQQVVIRVVNPTATPVKDLNGASSAPAALPE